ncbi:nucleophosmin 1 [Mytilus galloprovincialis]|uniref:Nucleophosmin 1 n=1 Tax=Mytilus galloprovincialis TaxID=29158 RepID=A0A8B6CJL9_MYTGA|nr:nucleophosmin 1 [Mytilus galloprovincialis]
MDRLPSTMNEPAREYFWGITLDKENPTFTWTFEEEEEDTDYLVHTLFLKQAVLGASAVKDERNLVQIETKNFDQKELKQPLLSLTLGKNDMTSLDVSFGHEVAVVFRLVEGSGPVCLSAQQLVEYPDDRNVSQDESELECSEVEEDEEEEEESPKKVEVTKKRKASSQKSGKNKDEDEEDMDEEEEDESMDDEEDEEEMSSPEKSDKKKGKKEAKKDDGKAKKGGKMAKVSPKKDANSKKAKKTAKAK